MTTYIWLNCIGGVDVVGIGASSQEAFTRLSRDNRARVTMANRVVTYDQYPTTKELKHNEVITR